MYSTRIHIQCKELLIDTWSARSHQKTRTVQGVTKRHVQCKESPKDTYSARSHQKTRTVQGTTRKKHTVQGATRRHVQCKEPPEETYSARSHRRHVQCKEPHDTYSVKTIISILKNANAEKHKMSRNFLIIFISTINFSTCFLSINCEDSLPALSSLSHNSSCRNK